MENLTAAAVLRLPVRLRGIQLGRPVDLLLETVTWRAVGFVVRCGDESERFLPYAASQPRPEEIAVGSSLMLLEDVHFYRSRGTSFRGLLGVEVEHGGRAAGSLRDVVLTHGGDVSEIVLQRNGVRVQVPASACRIAAPRASAA
jgi:hypothetical protein